LVQSSGEYLEEVVYPLQQFEVQLLELRLRCYKAPGEA
jgi:hypothetical protein